ncbi:hypothetical protein Btru_063202 [Bulinus truncatus]|nr:hypothetical protein Btru_063202 [Bulinus truncatus]
MYNSNKRVCLLQVFTNSSNLLDNNDGAYQTSNTEMAALPGWSASPMDTFTRQSRLSYCAAFGATAFLVYEITLQEKFAIDYTGPLALKSLIAIVSVFIYGLVFFPIFTCLALRTAFGYGLGSLYIWMFFIIDVYSLVDCADDLQSVINNRKARYIMRTLPSVVCRAFLSLSLPVRFVWAIKKGNYFTNVKTGNTLELTLDEVRDSYQGRHVRKLLEKKKRKMVQVPIKICFSDVCQRMRRIHNVFACFIVITLTKKMAVKINDCRKNLYALYRGDYEYIPQVSQSGAVDLCGNLAVIVVKITIHEIRIHGTVVPISVHTQTCIETHVVCGVLSGPKKKKWT